MDIFQHKKTLDLLYDFFVRGKTNPSRIPYVPGKCVAYRGDGVPDFFPRVSPEEKGIPSEVITALLHDLEYSARVNMHSVTVLCDGAVIAEANVRPYDRRIPHLTHSMCKSVTGLAIGFLREEGLIDLDTPAYRYFSASQIPSRLSGKMKAVTVRHLLTMTSGVLFAEAGAVTESDWVRAFFSSNVKFDPGSRFSYNSMNTYILSAMIRNLTGTGLTEYLTPRLFEPLGIRDVFWEKCPLGTEKGGWGLYIAQEDLAKIGMLFLDRGMFGDKRLISEAWIAESTEEKIGVPEESGEFTYAYQIWTARDKSGSYLFNGMLGQNMWICPKNRTVIIANAGNSEFFQKGAMLAVFEARLGASSFTRSAPLAKNKRAFRRLQDAEAHFFETRAWITPLHRPGLLRRLFRRLYGLPTEPLPELCTRLTENPLRFAENNCGVLPTFVRLMQNNHSAGLREMRFERVGERFFCTFDEGADAKYRIEIGFYGYAYGRLSVRGEEYRIATQGGFAVDEDGRRLLKIDICFTEIPHTRRIKVFFDSEDPHVLLREVPGREVLDGLLRTMPVNSPKSRGIVGFIRSRLNLDYIMLKIYDKFEPKLVPIRDETPPATETEPVLALLPEAAEANPLLPEGEDDGDED